MAMFDATESLSAGIFGTATRNENTNTNLNPTIVEFIPQISFAGGGAVANGLDYATVSPQNYVPLGVQTPATVNNTPVDTQAEATATKSGNTWLYLGIGAVILFMVLKDD